MISDEYSVLGMQVMLGKVAFPVAQTEPFISVVVVADSVPTSTGDELVV